MALHSIDHSPSDSLLQMIITFIIVFFIIKLVGPPYLRDIRNIGTYLSTSLILYLIPSALAPHLTSFCDYLVLRESQTSTDQAKTGFAV